MTFYSMARLALKPIHVPTGVEVRFENGFLTVKGPKGELSRAVPENITLTCSEDGREISATITKESKETASLLGTAYIHARNMIIGVSEGFTKVLELEGVGYRVSVEGKDVVLLLGFSHPVRYTPPEGIAISINKNEIHVSGINKELVGQAAAAIRAYKEPEPYKGKGIRYRGEYIARKAGKKAGVGG
jgi:large subunit ribosomal protein L6